MKYQLPDLEPLPGTRIDGRLIIAGPCSAESRTQVITTARALSELGVGVFRAGIWKPRTHPGSFEGFGVDALPWLSMVRRTTGMLIATEVATPAHVAAAMRAEVDILWIGARTAANPFAVQEIADALTVLDRKPAVLVKNPVNPDLELWIGAIRRIYAAGVRRIGAIHRGFSTYGQSLYRNTPHWSIPIELRHRIPGLPVICDPSHITGRADLVPQVAIQATQMGFDGLIIETHPSPCDALSDSAQQITPQQLADLLHKLPPMPDKEASPAANLDELRREIDDVDDELLQILARRMDVARRIGEVKKESGMSIVQTDRYNSLMEARVDAGARLGLSGDFLRKLLATIHEESVKQQLH